MPNQIYSDEEVGVILTTYRSLVPEMGSTLSDYWDLGRQQPWSCLVSNFHELDLGRVKGFHEALQENSAATTPSVGLADWLRTTSLEHGVGFSLGISPWTDDLILRTFRDGTRDVVVVLGHDWYPIVTDTYVPRSPLERSSLMEEPNYARAVPIERAVEKGIGLLFLNLYPHFRPPASATTGKISVSYQPLVRGLEALCEMISLNFRIRGLISWGGPVWEALQMQLDRDLRTGLWRAVQQVQAREAPLALPMGRLTVPYYPFLHPSSYLKPRFADAEHLACYAHAWNALLGERQA